MKKLLMLFVGLMFLTVNAVEAKNYLPDQKVCIVADVVDLAVDADLNCDFGYSAYTRLVDLDYFSGDGLPDRGKIYKHILPGENLFYKELLKSKGLILKEALKGEVMIYYDDYDLLLFNAFNFNAKYLSPENGNKFTGIKYMLISSIRS